jgi:hypothetical protein
MTSLLSSLSSARESSTNQYLLEFTFTDKVLGTQPKSAERMRAFLESRHTPEEIIQKQLAQLDVEQRIEEESERMWTTFFLDEHGPWIGTYQCKAMFKELLSSLGVTVEKRGSKQTHQHLFSIWACDSKGVIYPGAEGGRLHLWRNGVLLTDPDGAVDLTAHVQTPQGPRSIIKRHDYIEGASIRFLIVLPAAMPEARSTAVLDDAVLAKLLVFATGDGLGCSRSQGFGTFEVTRFDKLTDVPWVRRTKRGAAAAEDDE